MLARSACKVVAVGRRGDALSGGGMRQQRPNGLRPRVAAKNVAVAATDGSHLVKLPALFGFRHLPCSLVRWLSKR